MEACTVTRISSHVYWFSPDSRTDRPSLAAVVGVRHTLMLDAGNSPAHAAAFLRALESVEAQIPTYVVLTHWHWDHIFGADYLGLPVFAYRETARQMAIQAAYDWSDAALDQRVADGLEIAFCRDNIKLEMPDRRDLRIVEPDVVFGDAGLAFDLGGVTCRVVHVGGEHATDSCVIHIPEDKVLFLGDCLYADIYRPAYCYTPAKLLPLIDRVLSFDAEIYIEGHNPSIQSRNAILAYTGLLRRMGQLVDRLGDDEAAIRRELGEIHDFPPDEVDELLEYFLNGVRLGEG